MLSFLRAYTTLQVILIILLIAVLLGITLPRFGAGDILNKNRLRTTVYNVASDMRLARNLAITRAGTYAIQFLPQEYRIIAPDSQIIETKEIPSGVSWSGTSQYSFLLMGNADWTIAGGAISFAIASGQRWTIAVIRPTGGVRIQKP